MHKHFMLINILGKIFFFFFKELGLSFSLIRKNKQMAAQCVPFGYYDKISIAEM